MDTILRRWLFQKAILIITIFGLCIRCNAKQPHIVFMIVDDLGWNDVSFHGSLQIPTPNIDVIARDGIILNNYYTTPVCSPSRGALMTGKYPIRIGFQHRLIVADAPWGLPLQERILPQYLKSLGYSTRAVGKWHLGFYKEDYLPLNRGFDSFFGYYTGVEDYYTHFATSRSNRTGLDLHDNNENAWSYDGVYGTELFTEKAKDVISRHNSSEPLFLYFSQQAPHSGNFHNAIQVPDKYVEPLKGIEDEERRRFAGMVSAMDFSVGEIFEALENASMLDDTIFIFTTDNGGAVEGTDFTAGSNYPLRGSKYNLWEGGIRGVAFLWSPLLRQHSRVYDDLMFLTDWLPTLLSAANSSESQPLQDLDGFNIWPSLINNSTSPREEVLLNIDRLSGVEGIRWKNYKLINGSYFNGHFDGWYNENGRLIRENHTSAINFEIYQKTYLKFLNQSKAARIIQEKYNTTPCSAISDNMKACSSLQLVVCDEPSLEDICDPNKEICLYDIENDPCEFHNIAAQNPEIVQRLESQIRRFDAVEVPPLFVPPDPAADPSLHGMAWTPWK